MPGSIKAILNKPPLATVATTGAKADVGLGNVDNTSDTAKPVSVLQAAALALKANVTEVNAALATKAGIHSTGLKNRIINGDMRVAQRGATGSTTAGSYTLDRWLVATTGTPLAWGNPLTGNAVIGEYGVTSLAWEGAAGNTGLLILQRIESKNCSDMAGKVVTVSFFTYQDTGVTRTITPALVYSGGAADSWSSQVGIQNIDPGTPVPSGVWTKVTNRFNVPTAAITGMALYPWGAQIPFGAGTQGRLVNVQLEIGDVATPFERQSFAVQLGLCQFYYRKDVFGHNVVVGTGQAHTTASAYILVPLTGAMRVPPTIVVSGGLARLGGEAVGWPAAVGYGPSGISFNIAWSSTPFAAGDAVLLAATGSFTITRDAEL